MFNILNKKKSDFPTTTKASDIILYENIKKDKLNITNETINQARKGDARAQFLVGNEYYHNNTKADYLKALEWYYRSASNGYSNAQCSLGYMYYTGNEGVPADKQMAIQWYAIAASHGNMGAVQMVQHLNAQGFYAQMDQTELENDMNQCTIDTPTSEKVLLYEKSAPNVPLRDEKSQQEERPDAQNTDEVERLKIENGVLLKQHKEDQEEKKYMTERIKSLEEQIHKLTTERDEQRQKLIDLQDGAHGTKEANNDLCYSSQDELNNDLNYDTPEE